MKDFEKIEMLREILGLPADQELVVIATVPSPEGEGLCRVCNKTVVKLPALECVGCARERYLDILHEEPASLREYDDWCVRLEKARAVYEPLMVAEAKEVK